jgi:hypothetical protein
VPLVTIAPIAPLPPTVQTTGAAGSNASTAATLQGTVNPNGETVSDCRFEYGTTAYYGASVPCAQTPAAGESAVGVSAEVAGLSAHATYHFRLVATNPAASGYGNDKTFTTPLPYTSPPPPPPPTPIVAPGPVIMQPVSTAPSPPAIAAGSEPTSTSAAQAAGKPQFTGVALAGTALVMSASGMFAIDIRCPTTDSVCAGTVTLRTLRAPDARRTDDDSGPHRPAAVTLATGSFSIPGGQMRAIELKLSADARRLLSKTRTLGASATISPRDRTAAARAVTVLVTLRTPAYTRRRRTRDGSTERHPT